MRPRTFILLILVLLVAAVAVVLIIANSTGGGPLAGILPGGQDETPSAPVEEPGEEPGVPAPTATPSLRLEPVVVARVRIPVGERLTADLLAVEQRPNNNIALQGGYAFADPEELVGSIVKVEVAEDQAILRPMIALNPSDIASLGSDLALYIEQGEVAVAFPINRYSGAAYAMRPGDLVDVLMTTRIIEIDPEFRTALPNDTQRVIESDLLAGRQFLFPKTIQGRLEVIPEINQVAEIVPSEPYLSSEVFEPGTPIPKRSTQLTIQQAEVLWVGTWQDPRQLEREQARAREAAQAAAETEEGPLPTPTPLPERFEPRPDVLILSMTAQDALALKWSLERGVDIDLALRAQGDESVFVTTSVSLPQIVDQGGLALPEESDFDLHPRPEEVPRPILPPEPPEN